MKTHEFHWVLTGWRASAIVCVLLAIPVSAIFAAGFIVGRLA